MTQRQQMDIIKPTMDLSLPNSHLASLSGSKKTLLYNKLLSNPLRDSNLQNCFKQQDPITVSVVAMQLPTSTALHSPDAMVA